MATILTGLNLLINAGAALISAYALPGVEVSGIGTGIGIAVVLALVNALIQPLLTFLVLPTSFLSLAAATFIVNSLIILFAAAMVPGFRVRGFWWALLFGLILGIINGAVYTYIA